MILKIHFQKTFLLFFLIVLITQCKEAPNEPIYIRPDLIQITINSPFDSSKVFDPLVISSTVVSQNPIVQVNFFIDQKILGSATKLPYTLAPDLTPWADNEMHTIKCTAIDNQNNVNSAKVIITISDQVKNNITLLDPEQSDTIRNTEKVNFSWHHDPVKKFRIQISRDIQFSDIVQFDSTNQKNFQSIQLNKGNYYWHVGYYSEDISGIFWSGTRRFTIDGPRAPKFISHQNEDIRNFKIENTFKWNEPEFATQYQFQMMDYFTNAIIYDDILNDPFVTKNLELYVYKVKVKAKNSVNIWGEWSSEIIFSNGIFSKQVAISSGYSVGNCLALPDSGFIISQGNSFGGLTRLVKLNSIGDEEFNNTIMNFNVYELALTSDQNLIMVGNNSNHNAKVVKVDQTFNTIWEYEPNNNDKIYLTNVTVAQSGDYLLTGLYNADYATFDNQIYYSSLSSSGTPLFERIVGDPRSTGYHIEELFNGYLIMATLSDSLVGGQAIYNLLVDLDGSILSEYKFLEFHGFPGETYDVRDGIKVGNDLYTVGTIGSAYGSFVHKSDLSGTEHWKVDLFRAVPSMAQKCISNNEGNLLIGGYEANLFLFKVSPNGNIIWGFDNEYENASCADLLNTLDGGIVLLTRSGLFIKLNNDGVTYKN